MRWKRWMRMKTHINSLEMERMREKERENVQIVVSFSLQVFGSLQTWYDSQHHPLSLTSTWAPTDQLKREREQDSF